MLEQIRILVVDDEERLRQLVRRYLEKEGYLVDEAVDGNQALVKLGSGSFHLVILDLMLPEIDGWTVCQEIRKRTDMPVIMLTARGEESDRVLGFELGADDYVVKPFSPRELVARVKVLLRRTGSGRQDRKRLELPEGLVVDQMSRMVFINGQTVNLTPKEFDLLFFLASHPTRVFTRENMLSEVWGYEFYGDLRTVDTHIKNLREKLARVQPGVKFITTVWGVGYKFEGGT